MAGAGVGAGWGAGVGVGAAVCGGSGTSFGIRRRGSGTTRLFASGADAVVVARPPCWWPLNALRAQAVPAALRLTAAKPTTQRRRHARRSAASRPAGSMTRMPELHRRPDARHRSFSPYKGDEFPPGRWS